MPIKITTQYLRKIICSFLSFHPSKVIKDSSQGEKTVNTLSMREYYTGIGSKEIEDEV